MSSGIFYNIIFIPSLFFYFTSISSFCIFYIIFVRIYEDSLCYLRQKEATTKCHLCCIFYLDYWTPWAQYSCWWLFILFFLSLYSVNFCILLPSLNHHHPKKNLLFSKPVEEFINIFQDTFWVEIGYELNPILK